MYNTPQEPNSEKKPEDITAPAPLPTAGAKKPVGLMIATAVCAVVAVGGIAFGIYGALESSRKSQRISDLEATIVNKDAKIAELEAEISGLSVDAPAPEAPVAEPEAEEPTEPTEPAEPSVPSKNDNEAIITLGDKLDSNDSRTVFKIGDCTADGPSVKCPVTVDGKEALISYNSNDSILRLTLPND